MTDKEELYEILKSKVDKLEYVELKEVKESINDIKLNLNTNNLLTQQSIDANKQLSETMETFKVTMIEMGQSLKDGNKISSELAETVRTLNNKVDSVEDKMDNKFKEFDDKIDKVDSKSKIDILELQTDSTKDNIKKYLIGGGLVGGIVLVIELIIKFI